MVVNLEKRTGFCCTNVLHLPSFFVASVRFFETQPENDTLYWKNTVLSEKSWEFKPCIDIGLKFIVSHMPSMLIYSYTHIY